MTAYRFQDILNLIPKIHIGKVYGNENTYIKLIEAMNFEIAEENVSKLSFYVLVQVKSPEEFYEGKVHASVHNILT
jgi:hypothetical protein